LGASNNEDDEEGILTGSQHKQEDSGGNNQEGAMVSQIQHADPGAIILPRVPLEHRGDDGEEVNEEVHEEKERRGGWGDSGRSDYPATPPGKADTEAQAKVAEEHAEGTGQETKLQAPVGRRPI
jgi:hypothetical protein